MARLNTATRAAAGQKVYTFEGAPAVAGIKPIEQLKRSVLSCFLWEKEFYEDGQSIADRIRETAEKCRPEDVAALAVVARNVHNLRHVPLLLTRILAKTGAGKPGLVSGTLEAVIQRADEVTEFLAIYMADGKDQSLSGQVKKGLARAIAKFDGYQLAKYDRDTAWKLKDAIFMAHAKPGEKQLVDGDLERKGTKMRHKGNLLEQLIEGTLPTPDTWETELSAGKDKKETWERLLREQKLGYLAVLRNLRNMEQVTVDRELIKAAILARKGARRVLPFRYISAARAAPQLEPVIDQALCAAIGEMPPFMGHTGVLVDVSGSMDEKLSAKSDLKRMDAACALAAVINAQELTQASFSQNLAIVPPRRGMAGVDALRNSQPHGSTYLGASVQTLCKMAADSARPFDRLIVISDEQSHDAVPAPHQYGVRKAYMINVASYRNGVGYRNGWTHVDGFSEGVLKYIYALEQEQVEGL